MTLARCIQELADQGKIPNGKRTQAQEAYDRQFKRLRQSMSEEAASAEAGEYALRELEFEAAQKRRQMLLQASVQQRIERDLKSYKGNKYNAALAVLGSDAKAPYVSVEAQHKAILGRSHAKMEGVLNKFSRNLIGETRNKADLADVVREAFGTPTQNATAVELNEAWQEVAEWLRLRFNKAGGNIGKIEKWGLPQSHDTLLVRNAGFDEWRNFVMPLLDREAMIDDSTGQPFTAQGLHDALQSVFQTIASDGWINRNPGGFKGSGKLANRRADPRFLRFATADDWIKYQDRFGTGDAFQAMMGHIDGMSRDIAMMEVMGPNPSTTLRWLQDTLQKEAAGDLSAPQADIRKAKSTAHTLGQLYDVVSGRINSPVNERWARNLSAARSFMSSAMLGSAQLSAITDVGFQSVTRAYNGLPIVGSMTDYLKLLNPANKDDRKLAITLGLIAEEASQRAASLNRYVDGSITPGIAGRLSDGVLRASGLSAWTQAGKWGFGMSTLAHLAHVRKMGWDKLDNGLRSMMARYGIDKAGWDRIRATEPYRERGGEWLRPDDVQDEALADTMLRMVLTETDYAVPSVTARSRAMLSMGQQPGTLGGELMRNMFLFKSFGVSMMLTHGARMMEGTPWNRARYGAGLIVTTTLLGALAMQLKAIAAGKTPEPMVSDDPQKTMGFWARAMFQGGGFGIFGDFIQAGENRYGQGLPQTLAGPVFGSIGDLLKLGVGLAQKAVDPEKEANPGAEAINLLQRYTPGQSIWYSRLAFQRLILDQLQQEIDPDYAQSWDRMEKRARAADQEYWWARGQLAPEESPLGGN